MLKSYIRDESGATAIEYGLIAALIAVTIAGGAALIGERLDDRTGTVADIVVNATK